MDFKLVTEIDEENPILHDLCLKNGDLVFLDENSFPELVAQRIRIRLLTLKGEWKTDERVGFPYFEKVFTKKPSLVLLKQMFKELVQETPGVAEVLSVNVNYGVDRTLIVEYEIRVSDGQEISDHVTGIPYIIDRG